MAAKETIKGNINRIAETHFFLKPVLVKALKDQVITEEGKAFANGAKNYYQFWTESLNDRFFDMGTLVRLGTELEQGLKFYYMEKKGHTNLTDLKNDPKYQMNIFQRIMPWTQDSVIQLYQNELNYDLTSNSQFKDMQELMLYRHLYAHNAGLLNDKFVTDYHNLLQQQLSNFPETNTYPQQDTYFFQPLSKLSNFIESTRKFFDQFP